MKFDFDKYKGKYAMHCKTQEEADNFCRVMDRAGKKWKDHSSYLEKNYFYMYEDNGCYDFNKGQLAHKTFYINGGYIILEWSDFMEKEFTKADLKDGMVCVTRSGNRYMYLKNNFRGIDREEVYSHTSIYDDLTNRYTKYLDFVRIYTSSSPYLQKWDKEEYLTLIWEREKEITELTMEEIKEKLGINGILKIIDSKENKEKES